MLKSMLLNETKIPWWIHLLPFSRCSYIKKQIERILISRSDDEVQKLWVDIGISYESVKNILSIIAEYCDWKSINFIPSDECLCVFLDYDLELGAMTAVNVIEEAYSIINHEQLYEYIKANKCLSDFICFVLEKYGQQPIKPGSVGN